MRETVDFYVSYQMIVIILTKALNELYRKWCVSKVFWCFQEVEKGCIGNEWVKMKQILDFNVPGNLQLILSTYGNFSGLYFPVFSLDKGKYGTEKLCIWKLFTQPIWTCFGYIIRKIKISTTSAAIMQSRKLTSFCRITKLICAEISLTFFFYQHPCWNKDANVTPHPANRNHVTELSGASHVISEKRQYAKQPRVEAKNSVTNCEIYFSQFDALIFDFLFLRDPSFHMLEQHLLSSHYLKNYYVQTSN